MALVLVWTEGGKKSERKRGLFLFKPPIKAKPGV